MKPTKTKKKAPANGVSKKILDSKDYISKMNIAKQYNKTKKNVNVAKGTHLSPEDAYASASSLSATRLTLVANWETLGAFIKQIAVLMSYAIQSKGSEPLTPGAQTDYELWCPSMLYAYLLGICGGYFMKIGALQASTSVEVFGEYYVPTFVGKWLQQLAPARNFGRDVVLSVPASFDQFLALSCGSCGLDPTGEVQGILPAPSRIGSSSTEPVWFTQTTGPVVLDFTAGTLTSAQLGKLSSVIQHSFGKNYCVRVRDIPIKAVNCELKGCPVKNEWKGQLIYSMVDSRVMCDALLPLINFMEPTLLNSMYPSIVQSPLRMDGGLCSCPPAKVAFLFNLANRHPFRPQDSFQTYLRNFGFKDRDMTCIQFNLRTIDWVSVANICFQYLTMCFGPQATGQDAWYFFCYIATLLMSSIPGEFRAISPLNLGFDIAPLPKASVLTCQYAPFAKKIKMPGFLTSVIEGLKKPIRSGNQITFFISPVPSDSDPNPLWWNSPMTTNITTSFSNGDDYQGGQSTISNSRLTWSQGLYKPYNNFNAGTIPSGGTPVRSQVLFGSVKFSPSYFQNNFVLPGGDSNLYATWLTKTSKIGKRIGRFYMPSELNSQTQTIGNGAWTYYPVVVEQVGSWEACTNASALIAFSFKIPYYMKTSDTSPILEATFAGEPVAGSENAFTNALAAQVPQPGSSLQIQIGKTNNPEEVITQSAAESMTGALPDTGHCDEADKGKIEKFAESVCSDIASGVEDVGKGLLKKAGDVIGLAI